MRLSARLFMAITMVAISTIGYAGEAGGWQRPVIEQYGKVKPIPEARIKPSPGRKYQIVMNITKGASQPDKVASGLVRAARLVNLYALAGVPRNHLDLVAVISGKATASVLKDEQYQAMFGTGNPNTQLIQALAEAGVELYVCGQALAHQGIPAESVMPGVALAWSAMTALERFQHHGYVLLP